MPELNNNDLGAFAEAKVMTKFIEVGFEVLKPFKQHQRYDLCIEVNGYFYRVQVKVARLDRGDTVLTFSSSTQHADAVREGYRLDVDYFGVFSPDLDKVYLIPVSDVTDTETYLRLTPTENNQEANVRWAEDYVLP